MEQKFAPPPLLQIRPSQADQQMIMKMWHNAYLHFSTRSISKRKQSKKFSFSAHQSDKGLEGKSKDGEKVEMFGLGRCFLSQSHPFHHFLSPRIGLNEDLKIQRMEIFYDPETFIKVVIFFSSDLARPYYVAY